ncbi:MAG TPA: isoaspartyl peptidase/L-asparaginase [Flavobacteriales bacterium]|nr:isoaspartyl peptidase/L-asparaginase [Flavobacteriales bacterium]HIO73500.1 isoaspartyl peptidase/L-asparaginase [Flavobacteriales bacterium]
MRLLFIFALAIFTIDNVSGQEKRSDMAKFTLVIHGGAGTILKKNMTAEKELAYRDKLKEALSAGYGILSKGGSSIDAVEAAIIIMEDSPLFNAGKGAVFTSEGKNEMDASIMDGKTLEAGSVAMVNTIKNPISAARAVMEQSPHVMMVGEGAVKFAKEQNLEIVDSSYFYDEKRYQQWQDFKGSIGTQMDHSDERADNTTEQINAEFNEPVDEKFGTVGAVAIDVNGNIAAGTSTGGMTNKMYGRVGDSPIIGAGTYANNKTCGVSSTGHGEYFMRAVVAYDISAIMEHKGVSLQEAADEVIHNKLIKLGGSGGIISVDSEGNFALTFNTEGMYRGSIREDGVPSVSIYKD